VTGILGVSFLSRNNNRLPFPLFDFYEQASSHTSSRVKLTKGLILSYL